MAAPETKKHGPIHKVGNLTHDPELRFTSSGLAVANADIAVNTPKEPGNWQGEQTTSYYGLVCFGSVAENVVESLHKGDRVVVIGDGQTRYWEREDGDTGSKREIIVTGIGPDLRFATATVSRVKRSGASASTDTSYEEEPF